MVAGALRRGLDIGSAELRAEELRVASVALGRLVGRIEIEDLLDGIFGEFCIGK
jgi:tRNA modification GTPase